MSDLPQLLLGAALTLVPMILSLSVHEFAHAWSAWKLGDDTAARHDRLNLNPLSHIDMVGTIILPLFFLLTGGSFFFGWAKPVPVDPTRFTRKITMRTGMLVVAAAGPLSNLLMAILSQGAIAVAVHSGNFNAIPMPVMVLLKKMVLINYALFLFNMIPVYPLDGQKVLSGLLSAQRAIEYERFSARYHIPLMMGAIIFAPQILATPYGLLMHGVRAAFGLT